MYSEKTNSVNLLINKEISRVHFCCDTRKKDMLISFIIFIKSFQPTTLPIETLMSSHNSNLPISENTENDAQLTQLDHPDSIDGECHAHFLPCRFDVLNISILTLLIINLAISRINKTY